MPYIRSKLDIEGFVTARGLPCTVLGPGSFMDEIGGEFLPVKNGVITGQAACARTARGRSATAGAPPRSLR